MIIRPKTKDLKLKLNLAYAEITNRVQKSKILELPCIPCKTEIFPDYLALYHQEEDYKKTSLTGVCFFTDDNKFDGKNDLYNAIYYNDKKRLKYFKERFKGVEFFIEPDYTLTGDMDFAEKVSRRKKMRLVATWLATELKALVIPLITYGDERSFEYMLEGIEESTVVAFSTKGSVRNPDRKLLEKAIKYTVDNMNLKYIVVYSTCKIETNDKIFSYAMEKGIQIIIPQNKLKNLHEKRK